ncbi:NAD(P)-dependent oxidoreductase [Sabulilitoribacter multivorans]|uniref:NAD(P)-dependent oxidoreductase n=1 Tax=Flaviramulus multivorans TaxID=1304750 RepID=A0ABS9IFR0_9FLAO|nr:NAD(P)-dependent oxidoreductase [Flaviramulus multivorans]MCF7559599.1 NAD(P)-dependent oxidoreductase [Flaviramulus multivorans]
MKKVIFFGSEGYIGSHLVNQLLSKNFQVFAYDINEEPITSKVINYQKIDITDLSQLEKIDFNVDYVYYFAGVTGTNVSINNYNKFIDVNEKGLLNILILIKNKKVLPKIIFPSTRLVYKGVKDIPLTEDARQEFKTIYALNKFHNETVLKMFKTYYNIPYTVFRICVPYGNMLNNNYSYGTIGFFLNKAKNNEAITLYADGELKRTFTYVGDICNQILEISTLKISNGEVYNIGGETYSLKEVATMVANKFKVNVKYIDWPELALQQESGDTIFNSQKIEKICGNKYFSLASWINNINT